MRTGPKISEHELAIYRKHPELVQALGDKAIIHRVVLVAVFIVGFLLVAASKALKFGFGGNLASGFVELTVDLVFELGVALWGGVATTVLLQEFVKRQYAEGRRYQQEIMRQLATEEGPPKAVATGDTESR
jgi:hypothetical protein